MASVFGIFIVMFIVASLAFAPLGYFIYLYTFKNGGMFSNTVSSDEVESTEH